MDANQYAQPRWGWVALGLGVLLWLMPATVGGVVRSVATSGNNHTGCTGTPCRDINYCVQQMAPGDVCEVDSGTYIEQLTAIPSGSSGNPVIIRLKPGATTGSAIIRPQDEPNNAITLRPNTSDIVFDGLVFDGRDGAGTPKVTGNGLAEDSGAPNTMNRITIKNCEFRYFRKSAIIGGNDSWLVDNTYIHDNGKCCCGRGGDGSECNSGDDHGIYYQGFNSTFSNNIITNPTACWGLQTHGGTNRNNNIFRGNIFFNNGCGSMSLAGSSGGQIINNVFHHESAIATSTNAIDFNGNDTFLNNTVVFNNRGGMGGNGGNTYRNNIFCGNGAGQFNDTGGGNDSSNYTSSSCPSGTFVNPASDVTGNYRLQSGASAMINTVACQSAASPDPDGTVRPQGANCDRGAYEFGGTGPSPAASTLAFVQHPGTTLQNTVMSPAVTVEVRDQFGARFPSSTASITLALAPATATLAGTLTQSAVAGLATFANLSINNPGINYTLTATSSPLSSATSASFDITASATGTCTSPCVVYVAPTGDDSQACTSATLTTPRRTLAGGIACLTVGGSTLYLRAGTYVEALDTATQFLAGGTSWSTPTMIAGYGTETVTIQRPATDAQATVFFRNATNDHYIVLDRIIIDANNYTDSNGLVFYPGTHHLRFQNGTIKNTTYESVFISSADDTEVLNSTLQTNNAAVGLITVTGTSTRTLIRGNTFADGRHAAIQATNGSIVTIEKNRINQMGATFNACAIQVGGAGNSGSSILTNVLHTTACGIQLTSGASAVKVYNNTVYNSTTNAIRLDSGSTTTALTNNLMSLSIGVPLVTNGTLTNTTNVTTFDPSGFVDGPAGNLQLLGTATAAINAGTTLTETATDFDGVTRATYTPYDIGAYEFTGVAPVGPTGGLSMTAPYWKSLYLNWR